MEKIYAARGVWEESFCACVDPFGSVTCNDLNLVTFLNWQEQAELFEYLESVSIVDPYDTVAIHVVDNGDILVPFFVTGLINTDAFEITHT